MARADLCVEVGVAVMALREDSDRVDLRRFERIEKFGGSELVADRHSGGRVEIKVDLAVWCHEWLVSDGLSSGLPSGLRGLQFPSRDLATIQCAELDFLAEP